MFLGDVQTSLNIYQEGLTQSLTYSAVSELRTDWIAYRRKFSTDMPRCIYLTYANRMKEGLNNLLYSAQLSGISITVTVLSIANDFCRCSETERSGKVSIRNLNPTFVISRLQMC